MSKEQVFTNWEDFLSYVGDLDVKGFTKVANDPDVVGDKPMVSFPRNKGEAIKLLYKTYLDNCALPKGLITKEEYNAALLEINNGEVSDDAVALTEANETEANEPGLKEEKVKRRRGRPSKKDKNDEIVDNIQVVKPEEAQKDLEQNLSTMVEVKRGTRGGSGVVKVRISKSGNISFSVNFMKKFGLNKNNAKFLRQGYDKVNKRIGIEFLKSTDGTFFKLSYNKNGVSASCSVSQILSKFNLNIDEILGDYLEKSISGFVEIPGFAKKGFLLGDYLEESIKC